jgi:hypothetical protein
MAATSARGDWCTFEYLLRLVLTHSPNMLMQSVMAHRALLCATKAGSLFRYEKGIMKRASGLPTAPPLQLSAVAIMKAEV